MATELKIGDVYVGTNKGTEYRAVITENGVLVTPSFFGTTDQYHATLAQASKAVRGYSGGGTFWHLDLALTYPANACEPSAPDGTINELHQQEEPNTMSNATAEAEAPVAKAPKALKPDKAEATEPKVRARTTAPLEEGQKFSASFKNHTYTATVVKRDGALRVKLDGIVAIKLGDDIVELPGADWRGLSTAGEAITGYAVTAGSFWTQI